MRNLTTEMSATADTNKVQAAKTGVKSIFEIVARADRAAIVVTRLGLIVVLLWIGGLKVFKYEAVSIVPLVANSPQAWMKMRTTSSLEPYGTRTRSPRKLEEA